MAVPKELEIQAWQRKPGLKNPLTREQVKWVNQQVQKELGGVLLKWDDPQEVAEKLIPQGKNLREICEAVDVF